MTGAFVLAVLFTALFAIRSIVFVAYWSNPAHRDQDIEGWMTPRYIARSWHLPEDVLLSALGLNGMPGRRMTLAEIARAQGIPLDELEARIATAAQKLRSETQ